ncbi:hypothetical protein SIN8267_00741 [Sinobacterium norvegicum]|uniref:DUF4194 domain-containing protein n=1 Tax=Sinobacterium norvegicum TaxID=1641715 RepID=A0ABM9ABR7_9GAMM|nr:DUF4194 domain-containing protein [Sinobacterium norvegicum]CAH0990647.1 hypothetical protein SIN8267_00741 [Sinobacterium norvegicum]
MLDAINNQLETVNLSQRDFSELVVRILDRGVIYRDDSQVERELYDRYLRVKLLLEEYLSVLGVRLLHDDQFHYLLAFPPGSEVPGLADDSDRPLQGLKVRLNQAEVALVLVLRAEYDKSLREGQIDETGQVSVPMEAVSITMKNLLNRSLPENILERKKLFNRLRNMRLIKLLDEGEQADSWIKIRPLIVSFVSEAVLDSIVDDLQHVGDQQIEQLQQQDRVALKAKNDDVADGEEQSEDDGVAIEKSTLSSGFEQFETASSLFNAEPNEGE